MTIDNVNNGNDNEDNDKTRAKVITITHTKSNRWKVDFEGVVTRRDIHRINRLLTVEFARAQRRYSTQRKNQLRLESMQLSKVPIIAPLTTVVPNKTVLTNTKIKTEPKEIVSNG